MKYPQLVSDRAVSTISEWLVARLEELGVVEAPIVYSRLLLSLLHTPLQVDSVDCVADIPQLKVSDLSLLGLKIVIEILFFFGFNFEM